LGVKAQTAKAKGVPKASKPDGTARTVSINGLCKLVSPEAMAHGVGTIPGVRNALVKLMRWVEEGHGVKLLASLQPEHLREYSMTLYENQPKSARKDLEYIRSIYDCDIQNDVLPSP